MLTLLISRATFSLRNPPFFMKKTPYSKELINNSSTAPYFLNSQLYVLYFYFQPPTSHRSDSAIFSSLRLRQMTKKAKFFFFQVSFSYFFFPSSPFFFSLGISFCPRVQAWNVVRVEDSSCGVNEHPWLCEVNSGFF